MSFRILLLFTFTPLVTVFAADPVADCRAAHGSDPEAHIACLEAALQGPGAQPAADTQASADPPHAETVPAIAEAEPTLATQSVAAVAAEPAMAGGASVTVVAAAEPPAPSGMGAEQVRAAEDDAADEELVLHIVGTSYNSRGLGTFRTEEGQVWRETTPSPERRRLEPDEQYTARIVRSKFGGYRMHVDGVKWMKTVERIE